MGDSRTLQNLIDDARARSDMTAGGSLDFVTDGQLTTWANQGIADLRDKMIQEFGDDYFATVTGLLSTTSNVAQYALPSDFYKLLGVDVSFDAANNANPEAMKWFTCRRFEFAERNRWQDSLVNVWSMWAPPHYRLTGSNIMFRPTPDAVHTYRVWYVPTLTRLVLTTDPFDFVHGWDDFVAQSMLVKILQKDELDASTAIAELARISERIIGAVRMRDIGTPQRVQDTARRSPSRSMWRDDFDEWYP